MGDREGICKMQNSFEKAIKKTLPNYTSIISKRGGTQQPVINSKAHALLFRAARIGGVDTHRVE